MRSKAFSAAAAAFILALLIPAALFGETTILFKDDFENQADGNTPDQFLPTADPGQSPDWDNNVFPSTSNPSINEIEAAAVAGNSTKKYMLQPESNGAIVLLGASFLPSTDRFVTLEYDILLTAPALNQPAGEILYVDDTGDLDGSGSAKIAIHIQFGSDHPAEKYNIFYTTGEDGDITADDGTANDFVFTWAENTWYQVRVVADQENGLFDIKVTNKSTGATQSAEGVVYNDATGGYIRKLWFGTRSGQPTVYFDNILVYQDVVSPPLTGPTITFQEYSKGPVKTNTGLDIDFSDESDLVALQYKIGSGGTWKDLTDNGTAAFDLTGGGDTNISDPVFILDSDFDSLPEGSSRIYFRATDDDTYTTESAGYLVLTKDTEAPLPPTVTVPTSSTISSLIEIRGTASDAVSGLPADSVTFTLQRSDTSQFWTGSAWGAETDLATTHPATLDGSEVEWTDNVTLPVLNNVAMEIIAKVDDNLSNGITDGTPFDVTVNPGFPEIAVNSGSIGPASVNTGIDIDFTDNIDLQSIQYKIGSTGTWKDLTSNGTDTFDLTGGSDTAQTDLVYILDTDFATTLPEGSSDIYFRAVDNENQTSDTVNVLPFKKDTQAPATVTFSIPTETVFGSLPTVTGSIADNTGGFGFNANAAEFSIQISGGNYWDGDGFDVGTEFLLPTTHEETSDDTEVSWTKNAFLPDASDLVTGTTYVFRLYVTDKAGNSASYTLSSQYDDVPDVSSITDPVYDEYILSLPFTVTGRAADNSNGAGLNADSTTFTLKRLSDDNYWDGTSAWSATAAQLPTTHAATSGNQQVTWTSSGTLPSSMDDGDYELQATVTNINAGSLSSSPILIHYDITPPAISTASFSTNNNMITVNFTEPVWGDDTQSSAIETADFTVTFQDNGGAAITPNLTGVFADSSLTTPLDAAAGYSAVYIQVGNSGGLATGVETIRLTAQSASLYDRAGNEMPGTENTGDLLYTEEVPPAINSIHTADLDSDGYIDALHFTMSEAVSDGSIQISDFTISLVANPLFSSVTNGDTPGDDDFYITFDDGLLASDTTRDVTYTQGTLADLSSNLMLSTGPLTATDGAGPAILSALASDAANIYVGIDNDDTVTIGFSEATNQPVIDNTNIDTALSLSGGHSWLDGAGGITSAVWSGSSTLVVTLSDNSSDPTITVGSTISMGGSIIQDGSGNDGVSVASPPITGTFSADTDPPGISSIVTSDADSDGYTDRLIVTFDENVDDTTIAGGNFSVSAGTIESVTDDGTSLDAVIYIELTDNALGTDSVPTVDIDAGGIEDVPGNSNIDIAAFPSSDGANPVLLSASGQSGLTGLILTFSEAVYTGTGAAGNITAADLDYADNSGGGAGGISSVTEGDGSDSIITAAADSAFLSSDITTDTIAPVLSEIFDAADLPALTAAVTVTDGTPPSITSVSTADVNGNGSIDALHIIFDEAVLDTSITPANFDVADIGGETFNGTTNGDTANDADIYITLTDGTLHTGQTPDLTYTAGTLTDLFGNSMASTGVISSTDAAAPVLMQAVTADSDGDGFIGEIYLTYSENVDETAISAVNYTVSAGTKTGVVDDGTAGDPVIMITLSDVTLDSGDVPDIGVIAGGIDDLASPANAALATAAQTALDGAAPVLVGSKTEDTDSDGFVDRLTLSFSEEVDDGTISEGNFTSSLLPVESVTDDGFPDNPFIYVNLQDGSERTDSLPPLSITAGGIDDLAGNTNAAVSGYAPEDKAVPVLISATSGGGSAALTLTFSEAVYSSTGGSGALDTGDISYTDGSGGNAGNLTGTADGDGSDAQVELTADAVIAPADFDTDTVAVAADSVYDASDNIASESVSVFVTTTDTVPPAITAVETYDGDGNGLIDGLYISFSEAVLDSSITAGDFNIVDGGTDLTGESFSSFTNFDNANNEYIYITFTEDPGSTTAAAPDITYTAGTLTDLSGNALASTGAVASADAAGPAVLNIDSFDLDSDGLIDALQLTFSEPVLDSSVTAGNFDIAGLTGEAFSSGTNGDTADDSDIYITFIEDAGSATDATPSLTYSAGTLTDALGNAALSTGALPSTDAAPPILMSSNTFDLNSNGLIDALHLTFSEPVSDASISAGDFTITGLTGEAFSSNTNGDSADDSDIYITFTEDAGSATDAAPDINYTAGGFTDFVGNFLADFASFTSVDTAPPVILNAYTFDLDANGLIDALDIQFSEAVSDTAVSAEDFDVAGLTGEAFSSTTNGDNADDSDIYITFTEDAGSATDAVPTVTAAAGGIEDLLGNPNILISNAPSTDTAAPVLLSASSVSTSTTLTVTFSEPVYSTSGGTGALANGDFSYTDVSGSGAGSISSMTDADGSDNSVSLGMDAAYILGDFNIDTLAAASSEIFDSEGNTAAVTAIPVTNTDTAPPAIIGVETADLNEDGELDALYITFSEAVLDSSISAGDFTISGVGNPDPFSSTVNGDAADDNDIYLTFTASGLDTEARPDLSYSAASLTDLNGNALAAVGPITPDDLASPVLMSADTADADGDGYTDRIILGFSEPVNEVSITGGQFSESSGNLDSVSDHAGASDSSIRLNLTDSVLLTDAVPSVTVGAGGIEDLAGNSNIAAAGFASSDAAGPAVISAVSSDETNIFVGIDGDDTVTIGFSENTNQPTVNAGNIDSVLALSGGHSWLDGAGAIGSAAWSDTSTLVVTLSDTTTDPTVAVGDTITLDGSTITDGTNVSTAAVFSAISGTFSADTDPPGISAAETADLDEDGYIDALRITFTEPVLDASVTAADFNVSGVAGETFEGDLASDGNDDPNDDIIYLHFNDGNLGSGVVPTLTYTAGTLTDLNNNFLADTSSPGDFTISDAAGPAVLSAVAEDNVNWIDGIDGDDTVTLTFSEATTEPLIDETNIDAVMTLSAGHSWLDGSGLIGPVGVEEATWSDPATLIITLSVSGGLPTVAVGDTITLDGSVLGSELEDAAGNTAVVTAFSAISGTFDRDSTPPQVLSIRTADTSGNGFINTLTVTFDEPVDSSSIIENRFGLSEGDYLLSVGDGSTEDDAVIVVTLKDGAVTTAGLPSLVLGTGAVSDLFGNGISGQTVKADIDGAGPAILTSLAMAGENRIYLELSEYPSAAGGLAPEDFTLSIPGISIVSVEELESESGNMEISLVLSDVLTAEQIFSSGEISLVSSQFSDAQGNAAASVPRRLSDIGLGIVTPVWASDGNARETGEGFGKSTVNRFDGSEWVTPADIVLQFNEAFEVGTLTLYYTVIPEGTSEEDTPRLLPEQPSLSYSPEASTALHLGSPGGSRELAGYWEEGALTNFLISAGELTPGSTVQFVLANEEGIYFAGLADELDPRTVVPWEFSVETFRSQSGGVTILNNIIKAGEDLTRLVYTVTEEGPVNVFVSGLGGRTVAYLFRGQRQPGSYNADWDGLNTGGRPVAPGVYFIKISGPGINEIRKVLVVK